MFFSPNCFGNSFCHTFVNIRKNNRLNFKVCLTTNCTRLQNTHDYRTVWIFGYFHNAQTWNFVYYSLPSWNFRLNLLHCDDRKTSLLILVPNTWYIRWTCLYVLVLYFNIRESRLVSSNAVYEYVNVGIITCVCHT